MTEQTRSGEDQAGNPILEGGGDVISISGNIVNSTIIVKSVVKDDQVVDLEKLAPEPGEAPYQGLQYFDERDARRFFGREQLTIRLIGRLQRSNFLAVIGASGSGKSSLVRAGVIPALKSGNRLSDGSLPPDGSRQWIYRVFNPGGHPLDALAATLSKEAALPSQIKSLRDELAGDPKSLAFAIQGLLSQENSRHLLLVVDQFEEIFTQARSLEERQEFINALVAIANPQDNQPVSLLVILRADFYAQVAQHDQLREMVSQHQEFIGAMNRAELVDAIVGPLNQNGWKIQEGLVKVILDDVGYEPGALPLLSHSLLETWKRRRGRTLTLSGYNECGGVNGAIRETAEAVFRQRLTPQQQTVARMIFLRLAEINEDAQDTRRRASFSELITRSTDELTIQSVINILADARLIITGTVEPGETKIVEVAHESLIREWPTLRQWLNEDRQGLILHRQLTEAAEDWIKNERDSGLLFRGTRLVHIQAWAAQGTNADTLSLEDVKFLEASQDNARVESDKEARLARLRRTQRIFATVTVSLLVVVGILGYLSLRPSSPPVMTGLYNVAVTRMGEINFEGQVRSSGEGDNTAFSREVTQALQSTLKNNSNILIWQDGLELKRQGVQIGALVSDTPEGQIQAAASLAQRLNADMVIYGVIDQRQQPPVLNIQMYLAPRLSDTLNEVKGNFQLNTPVPVTSDLQAEPVKMEITRQAGLLATLALAQSESQLGHTVEALEYYLNAAQFEPDSDILQFFIGREYLFNLDRPVLQVARQAFEQKALEALEKSLQLNPQNTRASIGLGSLYLSQAKQLVEEATSKGFTDQNFQQAIKLLDQAETAYGQVSQSKDDPSKYGVPVGDISRLGLGDVQLLRGIVLAGNDQTEPASEAFRQAVQILEATLPAFLAPGLNRYQAQNLQFLGNAYQWSGNLSETTGDYPEAIEFYQQAVKQLDACLALGENSPDRVIQFEIAAGNCEPMLQQTEQRLQILQGGS
jgi:tetratricopeptide (TPR) repeat protein